MPFWHPNHSFEWIVNFGQDASWTTISAKSTYGHENSSRSKSLRRSLSWLIEGSDRKSTRLNSSHSQISYAVFCLKKKKKSSQSQNTPNTTPRRSIHIAERFAIWEDRPSHTHLSDQVQPALSP